MIDLIPCGKVNSVRFRELIDDLDSRIGEARSQSLDFTVLLLSMARLDLCMKQHDVSEDELKALCDVVVYDRARQEQVSGCVDLASYRKSRMATLKSR